MKADELVGRMAEAIATMEGYYRPGTQAKRNRNPGNLRCWGPMPIHNGFVVFPSEDAGFEALETQIRKNIRRGLNLYEFFGGKPGYYPGYAPDNDGNNARHYAEFVAKRIGIDPSAVLADLIKEA